jgi:hypothetical protein
LPLAVKHKGSVKELYLAMIDPTDLAVIDDIGFRTGHEIHPVLVGDQQIEEAILRSYRTGDPHGILKKITLDDVEHPGAEKPAARPAATERASSPGLGLQLASEPLSAHPAAADEPELVLTEKMPTPTDALCGSSPDSQRHVLQALVQLLISEEVIDPDKLFKTIKSIAGDRD